MQSRFLEYIDRLNQLHLHPAWYNEITENCTTAIRAQRPAALREPWDWRMLLNGLGDQMLYERHALAGDLPFAELKARALINERAIRPVIPRISPISSASACQGFKPQKYKAWDTTSRTYSC